jgi:hypothetical protein
MTLFMEHTMAYFDGVFLSNRRTNLEKYKHVMEHKFLAKLDRSLQYIELWIFEGFPKF